MFIQHIGYIFVILFASHINFRRRDQYSHWCHIDRKSKYKGKVYALFTQALLHLSIKRNRNSAWIQEKKIENGLKKKKKQM